MELLYIIIIIISVLFFFSFCWLRGPEQSSQRLVVARDAERGKRYCSVDRHMCGGGDESDRHERCGRRWRRWPGWEDAGDRACKTHPLKKRNVSRIVKILHYLTFSMFSYLFWPVCPHYPTGSAPNRICLFAFLSVWLVISLFYGQCTNTFGCTHSVRLLRPCLWLVAGPKMEMKTARMILMEMNGLSM